MKLGLAALPQIEALSPELAADLRQLIAAMIASWYMEHTGDGTHGDITGVSAAVEGGLRGGSLGISARTVVDLSASITANYLLAEEIEGAGRIILPSAGSVVGTIHGLSTVGRQDGDLVVLQNVDGQSTGGGFKVRLQATGTAPDQCAKFYGEPGVPNTDITISQNRWIWAMYSTYLDDHGGGKLWYLHQL